MSREVYYRQCTLTREGDGHTDQIVTWIPERGDGILLETGCTLRIKEYGASDYEPGRWTVVSVGSERRAEARVKERAHDWAVYRKATDV